MKPKDPELVSLQFALGTVIHEERWGMDRKMAPEEQRISDSIKVMALEEAYRETVKGRRL